MKRIDKKGKNYKEQRNEDNSNEQGSGAGGRGRSPQDKDIFSVLFRDYSA
jgi:hypothetical protein